MEELDCVLVAAGRGSRMVELTNHTPKPLLTLGRLPLLFYPLRWIDRAGFNSCIVVVQESVKATLQDALDAHGDFKTLIELESVGDSEDWGTADTLRHLHSVRGFKRDVLIVSCDLITDLSLHRVLDLYRTHRASLTVLLTPIPQDMIGLSIPGQKGKQKFERDIIGLDPVTHRLLLWTSEADCEETVSVRRSVLASHPKISIHSQLVDAHLYVLRKWVLDYLLHNRTITSIRGELIPLLVRKQFTKPKGKDMHSFVPSDDIMNSAWRMSSWRPQNGLCYDEDKIRCYAYVMDGGVCVRVNSLATYFEVNKQIVQHLATLVNCDEPVIHPSVQMASKFQASADCTVGAGTTVAEKSTIRRSVIGQHCHIGDRVKINNCVLLDHVTVDSGCSLQGTLVCQNGHVESGCDLKECLVTANQKVLSGAKLEHEVVSDGDHFMEI